MLLALSYIVNAGMYMGKWNIHDLTHSATLKIMSQWFTYWSKGNKMQKWEDCVLLTFLWLSNLNVGHSSQCHYTMELQVCDRLFKWQVTGKMDKQRRGSGWVSNRKMLMLGLSVPLTLPTLYFLFRYGGFLRCMFGVILPVIWASVKPLAEWGF